MEENAMSIQIDGNVFPLDPALADKPGWDIEINGEPVEHVETLTAINHQMGIGFLYGASPAGPYNQGRIVNRGGAVIVPTVKVSDDLYFLALSQVRPLLASEPIFEFPRGQAIVDEAAIETARRELLEETGLALAVDDLIYLGRGNPDSALVHGANVHCWWLRLPAEFILLQHGVPRLREDLGGNSESRLLENIKKAQLVREDEFTSPSILTAWAMGLVLQRLRVLERTTTREAGEIRPPYVVD